MKVSVSILSNKDRILTVEKLNHTNISYVHIDVMDGKFIDSEEFNDIKMIHAINRVTKYPLDIHLMVDKPLDYVKEYDDLNISFISFHLGCSDDINKVIKLIHDKGYKAGIVLELERDIKEIEPYLEKIDMVLVMSTKIGYFDDKLNDGISDKISELKKLIGDREILISVDGNINNETISLVSDADMVVSGSYVVDSDDYYKNIENIINFSIKKDDDKQ